MERFLHLWDEIDDLSAACRHMTTCAVDEVAEVTGVVTAGVAAFAVWLFRLPS
jgi:hypothetical protein